MWHTLPPRGYSGFQVTGIIVWGHESKPKKSHAEFPSLKNFQKTLNDITCLLYLVVLHPQNYAARIRWHYHKSSDCFKNQKNPYLNQATPKKYLPNFPTQKSPLIRHPCLLKSRVNPLGPPTWVLLNTCGSLEIQWSRQYLNERNTLIARWLFLGRDGSSPQQQPWGKSKMVIVKSFMYPLGQTKMPFVGSWSMWNVSGC